MLTMGEWNASAADVLREYVKDRSICSNTRLNVFGLRIADRMFSRPRPQLIHFYRLRMYDSGKRSLPKPWTIHMRPVSIGLDVLP